MHAIIAHNHVLFLKIFSNFINFCPNFHIFCPFFNIFLLFSQKITCMPLLSGIGPESRTETYNKKYLTTKTGIIIFFVTFLGNN